MGRGAAGGASVRRSRSRSRAFGGWATPASACATVRPGTRWTSSPRRSTSAASRSCCERAGGARRRRSERAAGELEAALGEWRGDALADYRFDEFAQREIARLDELRMEAVEERLAAQLAGGGGEEVVGELRPWWPSTRCASASAGS